VPDDQLVHLKARMRKEKKRKEKKRKEKTRQETRREVKKRNDCTLRHHFNKPSSIPGCPGEPE